MQPRVEVGERGLVLPLALSIMLLLGSMAFAVHMLRQQTHRTLSFIDGYLSVVAVGEAGFVRTIERLRRAPWSQRWFASGPQAGEGDWMGGHYDLLVGDGPRSGEVDLVVWARKEEATVSMHWRLVVDPYTLSSFREVKTRYFDFRPDDAPGGPGSLPALVGPVEDDLRERADNAPWVRGIQARLLDATSPSDIPDILGVPPDDLVIDRFPPARAGQPPRGAVSNPPPPPLPTTMAGGPGGRIPPGPSPPPTLGTDPPAPGTAVDLGRTIADLKELETQYGEALGFIQRSDDRVSGLVGQVEPYCSAGLAPACTCVEKGNDLLSDIRAVGQQLQGDQRRMQAELDRLEAAIAPPGPNEEQALDHAVQAQEVMDGIPDPCDVVNALVSRVDPTLSPCGSPFVDRSRIEQEIADEVGSLRGRQGACAP